MGLDMYTLGIKKGCHKNRLGSLAKEETLPQTRRYNKLHSTIHAVLLTEFASWSVWLFHALAGKLLTVRRQVPFGATLRLCDSDLLDRGRCLALLQRFHFPTPRSFMLVGSGQQQGS